MNFRQVARASFVIIVAAVAASFIPAYAVGTSKEIGRNEWYLELADLYYANTGLYFSLSDTGIPSLSMTTETEIYRYFVGHSYSPNAFLVEVATYPLPLAGAAVKSFSPTAYERAAIGKTNLIQALTATVNFPEPWSVSAFLGHVGKFEGPDSSFDGRGHMGILATYGNYHIKDNGIYLDHWAEFELKLKVDMSGNKRRYATSYRVGGRLHSNEEIKSYIYLALRRNRTDMEDKGFSFVRNTSFDLRGDLAVRPAAFMRMIVSAGKKFPVKPGGKKLVIGLELGVSWNHTNPYAGKLGQGFAKGQISPIIKPLIQF